MKGAVTRAASESVPARRIARALRSHGALKGIGITLIMSLFFSAYFYLLHHPDGPVTTMPLTAPDRWIGFEPWALAPYLSLWAYVCLPAVLMHSRRELLRFGLGISVVCLAGLLMLPWSSTTTSWKVCGPGLRPASTTTTGEVVTTAAPGLNTVISLFH